MCGISDDDLLSRGIPRTIIGAASFHGPVRYGKAWGQRAMVVREDGGKADLGSAPQHASRSTTLEEVKIWGSIMDYQALVKLRKGLAAVPTVPQDQPLAIR